MDELQTKVGNSNGKLKQITCNVCVLLSSRGRDNWYNRMFDARDKDKSRWRVDFSGCELELYTIVITVYVSVVADLFCIVLSTYENYAVNISISC